MNEQTLFGMNVFIREPEPKMTLSKNVPVTDEFRANVNAWMLDFFGTYEDHAYFIPSRNSIFMSSKNFSKLKLEIGK